ncbi:hypothetical protein E1A91_D05G087800v1 [Gossypium mustelinum]|uniref:Ferredoxin n=1 Tax=Gossypium mustelinum TaxID=34275 RepID=A0A5D2UVN1_GOSMU|nr:hypothetical protein E1A91_D05G087800v1 [Gossypium mustelinum]
MSTLSLTSPCIVKAAIPDRFTSAIVKAPSSLGSVKRISKSLGLKYSSNCRTLTATYKIKRIGPKGEVTEFGAPNDKYTLKAAEEAGFDLRSVDLSNGTFLDDKQMEKGYMLPCVSYPTSDCEIQTHKESELYGVK